MTEPDAALAPVLARYFEGPATATLFGRGLINRTYLVESAGTRHILQRINPIFDPAIHYNIKAVTDHLAACGLQTPRLVPTRDAQPFLDLGDSGVWRVLTFVDGTTFDTVQSPAQARAAAGLVARVHTALDRLSHRFVGMRLGVHDTPAHLARLRSALMTHQSHRLHARVLPLGQSILNTAATLPPMPSIPPRICHGDLKFNNLLFAGDKGDTPICLVDLDTVGPQSLAYELGDAWRSWCNPQGEEQSEALFDMTLFEASLDGYQSTLPRALTTDERRALLLSVEWISLELSARFAADALLETYFGWDPARFATRGDHNLLRAQSQWSLHQKTTESRSRRATLLSLTSW